MALDARTPGVYVQEVSIFPPSVTSVATAIPAFIGYTATGGGTIARISSMNDYVAKFGGPRQYIKVKLITPGAPTISAITTNILGANTAAPKFSMYYALQMYFANGGGPCYIASAGNYSNTPAPATDFPIVLTALALEDEPTLLVVPDARLFANVTACYDFYKSCLAQCAKLQDRFTIIDTYTAPIPPALASAGATEVRSNVGNQNLKYGAAYMPDLNTTLTYPDEAIFFENLANMAGFPELESKSLAEAIAYSLAGTANPNLTAAAQLVAIMKPLRDALATATYAINLAPSSTMAGVYAAVDRSRGVWKAPANISLSGVVKPSITISHDDQLDLNVPTDGKAINAIRAFTGKGVLVWGARTLAGNDNEWRYVSVRRLFIMIEESIRKATEWVVFEPNDANTWLKVKTMIENYLLNLWKDGALAGAVPKDAFFVKVGLNQTMTAQDILEGKLIVEIGLAAVRPAEFVILKFSHKLQES
jgi:phage tail sheath protein FI